MRGFVYDIFNRFLVINVAIEKVDRKGGQKLQKDTQKVKNDTQG